MDMVAFFHVGEKGCGEVAVRVEPGHAMELVEHGAIPRSELAEMPDGSPVARGSLIRCGSCGRGGPREFRPWRAKR